MTNTQKQISYWKTSAMRDQKTAVVLFEAKRYDACLFFCHLNLEKLLKGLVAQKTKKFAPRIHDLSELAKRSKIELTEDQLKELRIITKFNVASRYDSYKYDFYKECTKKYALRYLEISKNLSLCLKKLYPKK